MGAELVSALLIHRKILPVTSYNMADDDNEPIETVSYVDPMFAPAAAALMRDWEQLHAATLVLNTHRFLAGRRRPPPRLRVASWTSTVPSRYEK